MKKRFQLTDLDCANCARKMEDAIKKIDGVNDANVSFLNAEDDGGCRRRPVLTPSCRKSSRSANAWSRIASSTSKCASLFRNSVGEITSFLMQEGFL